jgi:hypothetical protein
MDIADISRVEIKGAFLCVWFIRQNKNGSIDECTIKYSSKPHPDFEKAWNKVRDAVVAMIPGWKMVSLGLESIKRVVSKESVRYAAKLKVFPQEEPHYCDASLILKDMGETMELCNAVNQLWHEVNAYIRGKQAQTVLQFEGPKEDQEAAREVR